MPRRPRIEYAGACYHVLSRGDRREPIFFDDADRRRFLETLTEACGRTGWVLHSYVLMGNHYHWLLETPEPNLVSGMRWFQGTYTQRLNLRHGLVGHVFQGRYKAIPVESESPDYFERLWVYIHLNPVRVRMLDPRKDKLESYEWSSHAAFVKPRRARPAWLCAERVFGSLELDNDGVVARRRYGAWMNLQAREAVSRSGKKELEAEWRELRRGWYHGGDTFRDTLLDRMEGILEGKRKRSFGGGEMRGHDERAAERLLADALEALGTDGRAVRGLRKNAPVKQSLAWLLKTRTSASNDWIDDQLGLGDRRNITRAVAAVRTMPSRELQRLRRQLEKMSHCPD